MDNNPFLEAVARFHTAVFVPLYTFITNNPVLMVFVVSALFLIGAKVFKRIKNASK